MAGVAALAGGRGGTVTGPSRSCAVVVAALVSTAVKKKIFDILKIQSERRLLVGRASSVFDQASCAFCADV
jgi:MFS superfamily sulfate permease-like transporter